MISNITQKLKELSSKCYHNIHWFIRRMVHIAQWAWYIKGDYEWDHTYLLSVIEFKLLKMKHYFEHDGIAVDNKKTAKEITECLNALNEMQKDENELCEKEWALHEKKWGELSIWSCDSDKGKNYRRMRIERDNAKTDKDRAKERKDSRKLYRLGMQRHKKAQQKFMNLFLNNYKKWWD